MGMVRISDDAEKQIKQIASSTGCTFTTTVDKILQSNDIATRMDKMGAYLKQRLDDLEAALDGAVLSSSSVRSSSHSSFNSSTPISWETLRDMWLDFLPDGAEEWLPGMEEAFRKSDAPEMGEYYIKDGLIVSNDMWGKASWMKVSPRVRDYLLSHGVENVL